MNDGSTRTLNAVVDMLFYHYYSLIKQGVEDPKQIIATELPELIGLSEEQIQYVKINTLQQNKLIENLDSSIELLSSMEESKTLDMESIKIVKGILQIMKKNAEEPLQSVFGKEEQDD
jgi:hypothetical protein